MVTKKTPSKRKSKTLARVPAQLRQNKFAPIALALLIVAFIGMAGYVGQRAVRLSINKARLNEIITIYDSLKMDTTYRTIQTNIFGDKRVYDNDRGRTFASEVTYGQNVTPNVARADVRKRVEAAGFKYVQTEYEGSANPIDEYKNSDGNYVRVGVMSAYVRDSFVYGKYDLNDPLVNHKDEAPAYVSVKVNLDDNNE